MWGVYLSLVWRITFWVGQTSCGVPFPLVRRWFYPWFLGNLFYLPMVFRQHILLSHSLGQNHGFFPWFLIHCLVGCLIYIRIPLFIICRLDINEIELLAYIFSSVWDFVVNSTIYMWMIKFLREHRRDLLHIFEDSSCLESKWFLATWRGIFSYEIGPFLFEIACYRHTRIVLAQFIFWKLTFLSDFVVCRAHVWVHFSYLH